MVDILVLLLYGEAERKYLRLPPLQGGWWTLLDAEMVHGQNVLSIGHRDTVARLVARTRMNG